MFRLVNIVLTVGLCVTFGFPTNVAATSPVAVSDGTVQNPDTSEETEAPRWSKPKRMRRIMVGASTGDAVSFKCLADAGGAHIEVDWYKDGAVIRNDLRSGGYEFRRKRQILSLGSVMTSDAGHYTCVVRNNFGQINHTYELDVAARAPHRPILQHGLPANKTVRVGDDVVFRCRVLNSDLYPHIQWIKHATDDNGTDQGVVLTQSGVDVDAGELTVRNVTYADAARYSCVARNAAGVASITAHLTVLPPGYRYMTTNCSDNTELRHRVAQLENVISSLRDNSYCKGLVYGRSCVRFIYTAGNAVTYARAADLCAFSGGKMLDIESDDMFHQVYKYIKENWDGYLQHPRRDYVNVWLASRYINRKIVLSNGTRLDPQSVGFWARTYPKDNANTIMALLASTGPERVRSNDHGFFNPAATHSDVVPICQFAL